MDPDTVVVVTAVAWDPIPIEWDSMAVIGSEILAATVVVLTRYFQGFFPSINHP